MAEWLLVACGGAAGALCRFEISILAQRRKWHFPLATLVVNALGSFLAGVGLGLTQGHPGWAALVISGFCGALTTFSAFAMETFLLWKEARRGAALAYIAAQLACSLGGAALGSFL